MGVFGVGGVSFRWGPFQPSELPHAGDDSGDREALARVAKTLRAYSERLS